MHLACLHYELYNQNTSCLELSTYIDIYLVIQLTSCVLSNTEILYIAMAPNFDKGNFNYRSLEKFTVGYFRVKFVRGKIFLSLVVSKE